MTFAPNHRSRNFTSLHYSFDAGGLYQASVAVYNIQGIKVKTLLNNVSLSQNGFIRWDGDDETGRKVGPGYYFFSVELFDTVNLITERKVLRVAVGF
jgi:hypothetical protein